MQPRHCSLPLSLAGDPKEGVQAPPPASSWCQCLGKRSTLGNTAFKTALPEQGSLSRRATDKGAVDQEWPPDNPPH